MVKPKGEKINGTHTTGKAKENALDGLPDLFGGIPQNVVALDFAEVNPTAIHSIIARICALGGYIAFSAPAGGISVKLSVTVGGSSGQRWNHSGQELAAHLLHVHKLLEKLKTES